MTHQVSEMARSNYTTAKLDRDLVHMANIICEFRSKRTDKRVQVARYISDMVRAAIERDYAKTVREMSQEAEAD